MKTNIYFLTSSEDSTKIRYIGKTSWEISKRLKAHLDKGRLQFNHYKSKWIKSAIKNKFNIEITLIGEVEGDGCKEEIAYIAYGRAEGWKLANMTDGGEGIGGYKWTEQARKNHILAAKNSLKCKQHIEKLKHCCKGIPHPGAGNNFHMKGKSPWNKGLKNCFTKKTLKLMMKPHGPNNSPRSEIYCKNMSKIKIEWWKSHKKII
jgi:hypothetical protein